MDVFLTLAGMFVSVLLILVILLQRGRGGGLVGSLSGLGGQSAFGTKAGDTFTRITIVIAAVWVMLAGITGIVMRREVDKAANFDRAELKTDLQAPSKDGKKSDTSKAKETESDAADDADLKESVKTEANSGKGKEKEKEPGETDAESKKEATLKVEKDVKPDAPASDPKETPKKEPEPKTDEGEKKEADGDAAKPK